MSQSRRCAACKYLRRRCPKDCIFAPYFPAKDLERFVCVHKIFGASNVSKMLEQVPEERRAEAAESMVWEARSRVRDPVHGSVGIITQFRQQIMEAEYELAKTQALIALFNAQQQQQLAQTKSNSNNSSIAFAPPQTDQTEAQLSDLNFDPFLQLGLHPQEPTSHYLEDLTNLSQFYF